MELFIMLDALARESNGYKTTCPCVACSERRPRQDYTQRWLDRLFIQVPWESPEADRKWRQVHQLPGPPPPEAPWPADDLWRLARESNKAFRR